MAWLFENMFPYFAPCADPYDFNHPLLLQWSSENSQGPIRKTALRWNGSETLINMKDSEFQVFRELAGRLTKYWDGRRVYKMINHTLLPKPRKKNWSGLGNKFMKRPTVLQLGGSGSLTTRKIRRWTMPFSEKNLIRYAISLPVRPVFASYSE